MKVQKYEVVLVIMAILISFSIYWWQRPDSPRNRVAKCISDQNQQIKETNRDYQKGALIVNFVADISEQEASSLLSTYGFSIKHVGLRGPAGFWGTISVPNGEEIMWLCKLSEDKRFEYVTLNNIVTIDSPQQAIIPETIVAKDPQWLTYSDKDISFLYPKTLCGTSWQEKWDTNSCKENWRAERKNEIYASGENDPSGSYIHILPSYSSFAHEFSGDIVIQFVSKNDFNTYITSKSLEQKVSKYGYQMYIEKNHVGYPVFIDMYYLTNGYTYIIISNNFPKKYPQYFSSLLDSIKLQ